MTEPYTIYGVELSPYSIKVRAYCRYKGIPHRWIVRDMARMEEFSEKAKLPLVPLVVTPEGDALQDSTPIIERLEERHPEPSILPEDPVLRFLSALIEEYADEWGNKHMFHLRWRRDEDQEDVARRLALWNLPEASAAETDGAAAMIRERMTGRVGFVGSNDRTAPIIEASFEEALGIVEAHLDGRPYLFGTRPALADFGLAAQWLQAASDPTGGAIMRAKAPRTRVWAERVMEPDAGAHEGAFEPWDALSETLIPLLKEEIAGRFLPWSAANAKALGSGEDEFSVDIKGGTFVQSPQKYHARSLAALQQRYRESEGLDRLDPILEEAGALSGLKT